MSANPKYIALRFTGATASVLNNNKEVLLGSVNINKPIQGVITLLDTSTTIATFASGTGSPIGPQLLGPIAVGSLRLNMTSNSEDITIIYE